MDPNLIAAAAQLLSQGGSAAGAAFQGWQANNRFNNARDAAGVPLDTSSATNTRNDNTIFSQGKSRDQILWELGQQRNDDAIRRAWLAEQSNADAIRANNAANANFARGGAQDTLQTLNSMYASAGNRLNDAARNSMNALNQAQQNTYSLFR